MEKIVRCSWVGSDPLMIDYHDQVWGRIERDSRALFEKLCLDGQQAGLSWSNILKRIPDYQRLFAGFEPECLSHFSDDDVERLLKEAVIIRNRSKIESIINNARAYVAMENQGYDFSEFLWGFVEGNQIVNRWQGSYEIPTSSPESLAMAKALKKRGFSFVGETICYAFMQAVGMINDHRVDCCCYRECIEA